MPMIKGAKAKTKKGISKNIQTERRAGVPEQTAIAIAFSEAGKSKSKSSSKRKGYGK